MTDKNKNALDLILSLRDSMAVYHHHKEQMAFRIVLIYLLGATALVLQGDSFWDNLSNSFEIVVMVIVIVLSALGAFRYVKWQLDNRLFAADMVTACGNLATRWIRKLPDDKDLVEEKIKDNLSVNPSGEWPKALVDEYLEIKKRGGSTGRPILSEKLTYFLMIIWAIAVLARSLSDYICKCI